MTARIPLRRRDGSVRAWAKLDAGDVAAALPFSWFVNPRGGYAVANVEGGPKGRTTHSLHRLVMGLAPGGGGEVDHINRDPLDNRRSNLRLVSRAQNKQNLSASGYRGSSSQYRGVTWSKKHSKWIAQAQLDGKRHYLGIFEREEDAAAAAAAFRAEHMPFSEEAAA